MRFGQPSASLPSDPFPFNEMAVTDPVSGRHDGLLERLATHDRVPKIFFTNTSCEYWRGDASLIHTDATGERDVDATASSRFYHFAGAQHSAGTLPLTDTNPQNGERGQQALNSVDYNPLLRALLVRPWSRPESGSGAALLAAATSAAELVLQAHVVDGRLRRTSRDGRVGAASRSWRTTAPWPTDCWRCIKPPPRRAGWSRPASLLDFARAHFADDAGGFFDTGDDAEQLISRPHDPGDNAAPSGRARLRGAAHLFGLDRFLRAPGAAEAALATVAELAVGQPRFFGWALAAAEGADRRPAPDRDRW